MALIAAWRQLKSESYCRSTYEAIDVLDNEFELGRITPLVVELWKLQWSNSIGSYAKKILITGAWLFALVHVFKGSSLSGKQSDQITR